MFSTQSVDQTMSVVTPKQIHFKTYPEIMFENRSERNKSTEWKGRGTCGNGGIHLL